MMLSCTDGAEGGNNGRTYEDINSGIINCVVKTTPYRPNPEQLTLLVRCRKGRALCIRMTWKCAVSTAPSLAGVSSHATPYLH